jgi:methionyl-tRNA formyltransferase
LTAPLGFTNVHPGKLPWYRGRSSVHWAIINNEGELGVTVHLMNDGIDTGDILVQRTLPILWEDTYGSMMTKLRAVVPGIVIEAVDGLTAGTIHPTPQPPLGSYYGVRRSGDEWIDWRQSSLRIYNTIRGIAPPGPCARTRLGDQTIMVRAARYDSAWPCYDGAAGEVVGREADGPRVKTGDSTIVLTSLIADDSNDRERPIRLAVGLRLLPRDELKQLRDEVAALRAEVSRLLPR